YVRDERGRSGIWFLSLDAARLPAVLAARATYRLPYFWSDMAVRVDDRRIDYRCRRRGSSPEVARCVAGVSVGPPLPEPARDELVHRAAPRAVTPSGAASRTARPRPPCVHRRAGPATPTCRRWGNP